MSNTGTLDVNGVKAVAAAVFLGTVGASTILAMPAFLGVIVDMLGLNEQQLGFVASVDIFTMAIAIGASAFGLGRFNWRLLALAGLVLLVSGNLCSLFAPNYSFMLWSRVLAGIGEGLAVGVSFAALGITRNPDRSFGIYLFFALIFSAAALYIFPLLVDAGGHAVVFIILISISLVNILLLPWLAPKAKDPEPGNGQVENKLSFVLIGIGLVMVTLFFIAQGAIWAYLERIGLAANIELETVGAALAFSALAGIAGAGLATVLGNKFGRAIPVTLGIAVQTLSMLMLTTSLGVTGFIVAVMMFNFSWNLCQPYFSGIMSALDPQGRAVVLMGSIQTIGVSIGPFIAALIIMPGEFDAISYLGIGCVTGALLATYSLLYIWQKQRTTSLAGA